MVPEETPGNGMRQDRTGPGVASAPGISAHPIQPLAPAPSTIARSAAVAAQRRRDAQGRPVLFMALTLLACVLVIWVLMSGPALPFPVAIGAIIVGAASLVSGWVFAGPRLIR